MVVHVVEVLLKFEHIYPERGGISDLHFMAANVESIVSEVLFDQV